MDWSWMAFDAILWTLAFIEELKALRISDFAASPLELYGGVLTGVLNVLLLTFSRWPRLQWWNWPLAVINAAVYLWLFYEWGLYGNMILQPYFLVICLIGCWTWRGQLRGVNDVEEIPTRWASFSETATVIVASLLAMVVVYPILEHYNDPSPLWDGLILTLSLGASYLQLRKKVQSWFLWIAVDIIAVPFHWINGHPATSLLYFVYGTICLYGLYAWWKDTNQYHVPEDRIAVLA